MVNEVQEVIKLEVCDLRSRCLDESQQISENLTPEEMGGGGEITKNNSFIKQDQDL